MTQDRLGPLCFLPPATGTQWIGPPPEQNRFEIMRTNGPSVPLESPLFWNEPLWYQTDPETADMVASAVAKEGVLVSALQQDLRLPDEPVSLLESRIESSLNGLQGESLPRIVPYRPERYGIHVEDFDGARMIDVRLRACGDWSGRFAYSAGQIDRWEGDPDGDPPAGGSWAPAAPFPPDVVSLEHLSAKFAQLRVLSPAAAIFISITPHRMDSEIPKLLESQPDGIILDLTELPLSGMELGQLTLHARRVLNSANAPGFPLWIIPGEITADDAVRLVLLGATGIAIDHWCRDLIEAAEDTVRTSPAARMGQGSQFELDAPLVHQTVREHLSLNLERFKGLLQRMRCLPAGQRLGSLDQQWARAFEVPWISIGRSQSTPEQQPNTERP